MTAVYGNNLGSVLRYCAVLLIDTIDTISQQFPAKAADIIHCTRWPRAKQWPVTCSTRSGVAYHPFCRCEASSFLSSLLWHPLRI